MIERGAGMKIFDVIFISALSFSGVYICIGSIYLPMYGPGIEKVKRMRISWGHIPIL